MQTIKINNKKLLYLFCRICLNRHITTKRANMHVKVITEIWDVDFEREVNAYVADGWVVQGFSHNREEGDSWYCALMVKHDQSN